MTLPNWPLSVTVFAGGRGAASITREFKRLPRAEVSLVVNGYDNGFSTGALRTYLPDMLGPSDFRKNAGHHLNPSIPAQAALQEFLDYRFPLDADSQSFKDHLAAMRQPFLAKDDSWITRLPQGTRGSLLAALESFQGHLNSRSEDFDFADCSVANLVIAGLFLQRDHDFNIAVDDFSEIMGVTGRLLNVTDGRPLFLAAIKKDGEVLLDEAQIVAAQSPVPIQDIHLLPSKPTADDDQLLAAISTPRRREWLESRSVTASLNPQVAGVLSNSDLIVLAAGTQNSSLLPSYLTQRLGDVLAGASAVTLMLINVRPDSDIQGHQGIDLFDRAMDALGDPKNERGTITHALFHRPTSSKDLQPGVPDGTVRRHCLWLGADLQHSDNPDLHDGARTVEALRRIHQSVAPLPEPLDGLSLRAYQCWLIDLDGTLVYSAAAHEEAYRACLAEEWAPGLTGFRYANIAGLSTQEAVTRLGAPPSKIPRIVARKQWHYRALIDSGAVPLAPGAAELLQWLRDTGHTAVVVTSASADSARAVVEATGIQHLLVGIVTAEDVAHGKPSPEVYEVARSRFASDSPSVVAVEDSAVGVRAALAAGIETIQVGASRPQEGALGVPDLENLLQVLLKGPLE